jgi:hypothetical protein
MRIIHGYVKDSKVYNNAGFEVVDLEGFRIKRKFIIDRLAIYILEEWELLKDEANKLFRLYLCNSDWS